MNVSSTDRQVALNNWSTTPPRSRHVASSQVLMTSSGP